MNTDLKLIELIADAFEIFVFGISTRATFQAIATVLDSTGRMRGRLRHFVMTTIFSKTRLQKRHVIIQDVPFHSCVRLELLQNIPIKYYATRAGLIAGTCRKQGRPRSWYVYRSNTKRTKISRQLNTFAVLQQ